MAYFITALKNKAERVSFRYIQDEKDLQNMLCALALLRAMGCINDERMMAILKKEDAYSLKGKKAEERLRVIKQWSYEGKTYELDTDSIEVRKNGEYLGCYLRWFNTVDILPDRELAKDFVVYFDKIEEIWAKLEAGRQLPEPSAEADQVQVDPAPQQLEASAEPVEAADSEEPEQPEIPTEPESSDSTEEADVPETEPETEAEPASAPEFPKTLTEFWQQLRGKKVDERLEAMSFSEIEQLYSQLKGEHQELIGERDRAISAAHQAVDNHAAWLKYMAAKIVDVNGPTSAANELLEPQPAQPQPDKSSDRKPKSDEAARKEAHYISRQVSNVKKWRAQQAGNEAALELLERMFETLKQKDTQTYKTLRAEYDGLLTRQAIAAEEAKTKAEAEAEVEAEIEAEEETLDAESPATNEENAEPESDEPELEPNQPESADSDDSDEADEPADADSDPEPQTEPVPEDAECTMGDVVAALQLSGYEVPKPFRMMPRDRVVSLKVVNQLLSDYGLDIRLAPER